MEVLSLDEFLRLKQDFLDAFNNFVKENENLGDEVLAKKFIYSFIVKYYFPLIRTLKNYDLSSIPATAWDGLFALGLLEEDDYSPAFCFDLSGTGANIDFSILEADNGFKSYNLKGCNVSHLEEVSYIDPNYFDEDVQSNNFDVFLDSSYPEDFRNAYMHSELNLELYAKLSKELKDRLNKDILLHRFNDFFVNDFVYFFSFEKINAIIDYYDDYQDLFKVLEISLPTIKYGLTNKDNYLDELRNCSIEEFKSVLSKIVGEIIAHSWSPIDISNYPESFVKENPGYFMMYPEVPEEVRERFYQRKLTFEDTINYYSFLKDFINMNAYNSSSVMRDILFSISNEDLDDLFSNHKIFLNQLKGLNNYFVSDIFRGSSYDVFEQYLSNAYPSFYLSYIHGNKEDNYSGLSFEEVLQRSDLRSNKENELLDKIVNCFGLDNIIRFQKESGYFLNSHYGSGLYNLELLYFLYSNNKISFDKDNYDSFCETINYIICKNLKEDNPQEIFINEIKSVEFRKKYSTLFIDENLLSNLSIEEKNDILNIFYSKKLLFSDVRKYPILKEALKDKNFEYIFQRAPRIHGDKEVFLEMCSMYGNYLNYFALTSINYESDISIIRDKIDEEIYNSIKNGNKYRDDLPDSFKNKYNGLFLPDNAPNELKDKFYSKSLTLDDFNNHPDWYKFFSNTDIICGFNFRLSSLIDLKDDNISFDENNKRKLKIISSFMELEDDSYDFVRSYISFIHDNYDKIDDRVLHYLKDILYRLYYSNSSKLSRISSSLVKEIAYSDDPMKNLSLIEQIYLQNHLPEVAKTYAVFRILHSNDEGSLKLNVNNNSSPVLIKHNNRLLESESIILSDLIKASVESNNKSIRQYLYDIKEGDRLYREFLKNGLSGLSISEKNEALNKITYYSKVLIALYNESRAGKTDRFISSGDLISDISECIKKLSVNGKDDYDVPDRLTRMYAYFAGFRSYEDMISHMDIVVDNANKRNMERIKRPFVLHEGDMIKGLNNIEYLRPTLRNGAVATEFLGGDASSLGDCTPLDTDLSYVTDDEISLDEGINDSISSTYGPIWLVIEAGDPDIVISRDENGVEKDTKFDKTKIEAFRTNSSKHFGIRTGFGSTHISYIVVEKGKYNERLGLEVVMNGFYIPIVNREGKLLFSPDDYERIRNSMNGLSYYGLRNYDISSELITPEIEKICFEMKKDLPRTKEKANQIRKLFGEQFVDIKYDGENTFTLSIKDGIDGDLTVGTVEVIDTGSTGRETNSPNDADFDYMFRLDSNVMKDSKKMDAIRDRLTKLLGEGPNEYGEFRVKKVKLERIDNPVDIDISFLPKRDKLDYTTDMCLKDRLNTIKQQYPKEYQYVIANIVYAKEVLKKEGCYYKYGHSKCVNGQGGLGGVGIENWILQNGGSFITATRKFLEAAYNEDKTGFVSFDEFKRKYKVWDFGENFEAEDGFEHDEFVHKNMSQAGYILMCKVLQKELAKYDEMRTMFESNDELYESLNSKQL